MRHNRTILTLAAGTVLAAGTALLLPLTAQAAVACNETALVTAVTATNAAGGGTVTLTPGCTYTLTAGHGNDGVHGLAGLPIITTPITFEGNANTITRAATAAAFRIAQVSSTGGITLKGGHPQRRPRDHHRPEQRRRDPQPRRGHPHRQSPDREQRRRAWRRHLQHRHTRVGDVHQQHGDSQHREQGAGIASVNGTLTLTSSAVNTNAATVNPGGIYYIAGSATLNTSTVTTNTPTNCTNSPSPVPGCIG